MSRARPTSEILNRLENLNGSDINNDLNWVDANQAAAAAPVQDILAGTGIAVTKNSGQYLITNTGGGGGNGTAVQSDWDETDTLSLAYIQNKPSDLNEFTNSPGYITIDQCPVQELVAGTDITIVENPGKSFTINAIRAPQEQSDWAEASTGMASYIKNKPTNVSEWTNDSGYLTLATTPVQDIVAGKNITISEAGGIYTINADASNSTGFVASLNGLNGSISLADAGNVAISTSGQNIELSVDLPTKTSDLTNDSGYVNLSQAAGAAPVQDIVGGSNVTVSVNAGVYTINAAGGGGGAVDSVNGQTGVVVLDAADVGALPDNTPIPTHTSDLTNDSGFITSADIPTNVSAFTNDAGYITLAEVPPDAVTSVNTKTGAVVLTAADVGAAVPADIPTHTGNLTNDGNGLGGGQFVDYAGLSTELADYLPLAGGTMTGDIAWDTGAAIGDASTANTFVVSTAGTERLRVDDRGYVGVNGDPAYRFHVYEAGGSQFFAAGPYFYVRNQDDSYCGFVVQNNNAVGGSSRGFWSFAIEAGNAANNDFLIYNSSVGPAGKLSFRLTTDGDFVLEESGGRVCTDLITTAAGAAGDATIGLTGQVMTVSTAGTERLRVQDDGKVSIGNPATQSSASLLIRRGQDSESVMRLDGAAPTAAGSYYGVLSAPKVSGASNSTYSHFAASETGTGDFAVSYGFLAGNALSGTSGARGFRSSLADGPGRWNVYADGTAKNYFAGQVQFGSGSALAPSIAGVGDNDTGIFFGTDVVAVSTAGTERLRVDGTKILASVQIDVSDGTALNGRIQSLGTSFFVQALNSANLFFRVDSQDDLVIYVSNHFVRARVGVHTGIGSAAAPSLSYYGDTNTGTFSPASDTWAISTGGTERLRVGATGQITAAAGYTPTAGQDLVTKAYVDAGGSNPVDLTNIADGTALNPSIAFNSAQNTGLFRLYDFGGHGSSGQGLGFTVAGALRMLISPDGGIAAATGYAPTIDQDLTTKAYVDTPRAITDGTPAAPAIAFANDQATGIFRETATNCWCVSVGGSKRFEIDTTGDAYFGGWVGVATPDDATAALDVNGESIRIRQSVTPASSTATGEAGEIMWDADFLYVCVATNTWKRVALTSW